MGRQKNANPNQNVATQGRTEQFGLYAVNSGDETATSSNGEQDAPRDDEVVTSNKKRSMGLASGEKDGSECDSDEDGFPRPTPKRVRFQDESRPDSPVVMEIEHEQAVPELTIRSNQEGLWTLELAGTSLESRCEEPANCFVLREYRLAQTLVVAHNGQRASNPLSITSSEGVLTLLKHCESACCPQSQRDFSSVATAVQDGTLSVACCAGDDRTVKVRLSLADRAFEECSAEHLPLHKRSLSKKYQSASHVHHALAELFPDSVFADVVQNADEKVNPISAKAVYDLIDNTKLRDYEAGGGYDSKPMKIPGLIPTLRPYQEAAVKWMLQREKSPSDNNEWKLAWSILSEPNDPVDVSRTDRSTLSKTLEAVSLLEWKSNDVKPAILYSPFTGLLAKSTAEAYMMTLNSFLGSGDRREWANSAGGILAESMGLGKTVEVLACVLAHRHPSSKPTFRRNAILRIEEEKKESFDDRNEIVALPCPQTRHVTLKKWTSSFGSCVCGTASAFRGCLSIVFCESCHEPLHGLCAGFYSLNELQAGTRPAHKSGWVVSICSSDRCPTCVFAKIQAVNELIESRETLIITPAAILTQWEREIRRHVSFDSDTMNQMNGSPSLYGSVNGLKVLVYPGIKELCNQGSRSKPSSTVGPNSGPPRIHLMHPHILANADIVLMTFDALMGDLGHSDDNPFIASSGRLRMEKKYRVLPSPLSSIRWFRVCLDEAQRVETPTATSAKMALKLASHHRWCVSGTPIGRGKLDDLYGLFSFLKLGPFSCKKWFQLCLNRNHRSVEDRISHLLSSVVWRSTKASDAVRDQIGIPEQVEKKVVLKFSSIEKHFYERQLEATLEAATEVMDKSRSGRSHKTADNLLSAHLHRLRAACCHPQVGSRGIAGRSKKMNRAHVEGNDDVSSSVLTMDQILDRLIDDTRVKCEESQRLAVMHTNALASLEKLKVEARRFGVDLSDSDEYYLTQSCRSYMESLELADSNAKPTEVVGEAVLSGCTGFLASSNVIRDGKATLAWNIRGNDDRNGEFRELWSKFDFEGPSKKIIEIRVRNVARRSAVPGESELSPCIAALTPKDCVFQVSSAAVGGEFVDVVSFTMPNSYSKVIVDGDWLSLGGFRTNRSKSWRILIKNYHGHGVVSMGELQPFYVGLEVQLMEPDIAADSLQRLHVLHNASLSLTSLLDLRESDATHESGTRPLAPFMSISSMKDKVKWMQSECLKVESLYMDAARSVYTESQRQLRNATQDREEEQRKLCMVSPTLPRGEQSSPVEFWDDAWFSDLLSMLFLYGSAHDRHSLCERVRRDLSDFVETLEGTNYTHRRSFPDFADVDGLKIALDLRFREKSSILCHAEVMQAVQELATHPSEAEISNNSHCGKCRADWNQTGPECEHCLLEKRLDKLNERDPLITAILKSLHKWLGETASTGKLGSQRKAARIDKRAECFFDVLKSSERELRIARRAWRTHFDLLSDFDEMNQCKRTIRLAAEGEDLTKLTADELGSMVTPWDIAARAMNHSAKQAMALATLRRNKDTLRYLKNQNAERLKERQEAQEMSGDKGSTEGNVCILCLSPFEGERAVLACGHSFHHSPCLEKLMTKAGNHHAISCPLRCTARTTRKEVMIASEKRRDDGSQSARKVTGQWGTKVTRLLSDIMEVSDRAEKSIFFSQWEDMLDVVEEALKANGVEYVRAKTLKQIGDCVKIFRSSQCAVLLLNVKNGAEGLTLVEVTHVFMIEPLLNCGLDSQAINRIHRIGQRSKTYVHRYLIENTIEIKIDKMRVESQDDQLEDALNESRKKHAVSAGGIDGGFSHEQLQEILH